MRIALGMLAFVVLVPVFILLLATPLPAEWLVTYIFGPLGIASFAGWLLGLFGRGTR